MDAPANDHTAAEIKAPSTPPAQITRYVKMCADANQIGKTYEICAQLSAWITLAGFVVLPSTFTSLENASDLDKIVGGKIVQKAVQNVDMLGLASVLCCFGIVGNCFLWYRWRDNYIWLNTRIFLQVS
jgi:hypothetical protein